MEKEDTIEIKKITADGRIVPVDYLTLEEILGSDWKDKFREVKLPWQKNNR